VGQEARIPVGFVPDEPAAKAAALAEWLREHRPEVVVARDHAIADWARGEAGVRDTPWAQLNAGNGEFAVGTDEGATDIAAEAVRCLVEKMRRHETGIGGTTRVHAIKGTLVERFGVEPGCERETVSA
jgi:hypothetical protein